MGNALTGSTGSGAFVGATSPSITTPTIATSLTFSPTTGGIVGTTTNDNTAAGNVGEVISGTNTGGTALTTDTPANITSISLTAGDWDVYGQVGYAASGYNLYTGYAAITTTSATLPAIYDTAAIATNNTLAATELSLTAPVVRMSLAGTTTVYLVGQTAFLAGTCNGFGKMYARRAR